MTTCRSLGRARAAGCAALVLTAVVVSGCGASTTTPAAELANPAAAAHGREHSIRFTIEGTAPQTEIVYTPGGGKEYHLDAVSLPWSITTTSRSGAYVYVSGWSDARGIDLRCSIYVDGKLEKSAGIEHEEPICQTATTLR